MIDLAHLIPHKGGEAKGLVSYQPRPGEDNETTAVRILELFEEMRRADALPIGPRQVGYRLKEAYPGQYIKEGAKKDNPGVYANFGDIGVICKRLLQSRRIKFSDYADGSLVEFAVGGYASKKAYLEQAHEAYWLDRRLGQSVVIEISTEAKETLPLIRRLADARGVEVYSGSGSSGPKAAHGVAERALRRAVDHGQGTLIFGIGDFDVAGIRNIMRPHIEHVSALLYATDSRNEMVIVHKGKQMAELAPTVSFKHIGLTPEMGLSMVQSEEDKRRIEDYIDSGTDIWSRDIKLLDGIQKIELEALNPVDLRDLVTDELDAALDVAALNALIRRNDTEQDELQVIFAKIANGGI